MKSLQDFNSVAISEFEMQQLKGGLATPVSGSLTVMGSVLTYSGTLDLTAESSTSANFAVATFSSTTYVTDFCGSSSYDGGYGAGCAQYLNGHWVIVGAS